VPLVSTAILIVMSSSLIDWIVVGPEDVSLPRALGQAITVASALIIGFEVLPRVLSAWVPLRLAWAASAALVACVAAGYGASRGESVVPKDTSAWRAAVAVVVWIALFAFIGPWVSAQ
jgi:hypothetical protein